MVEEESLGASMEAQPVWDGLDPDGPPDVAWVRPPRKARVAVLLGAFDPITNAHLAIVQAVAEHLGASPALCMTKVLLARGGDELLPISVRIDIAQKVATRLRFGLAFANRGTYLEVGRIMKATRFDPTFIVGADKLAQLADPSFYSDGVDGVTATFDELSFAVVPRAGAGLDAPASVVVIDAAAVFPDAATAALSATEVRRSHREGRAVDEVVPPEVGLALRGYTSAR